MQNEENSKEKKKKFNLLLSKIEITEKENIQNTFLTFTKV